MQRPLRERGRAIRHVLNSLRGAGHGLGTRQLDRLGLAAERLDPPAHLAGVLARLLQMLLEALLVGRTGRHLDVRREGGLQLLLLAVRLVQVSGQLCVSGREISHWQPPSRSFTGESA